MADGFDLDLLDDVDPFEVDGQAAHLFKHDGLGIEDVYEVWQSDPLFYPAKPPAHWLMVAQVSGRVLVVPLARRVPATRAPVARSAATKQPNISSPATGRTDDEEDEP